MPKRDVLTRSKQKKALALYADNRLDEARELCEKILRADRRNVEAWVLMGAICRRAGDLQSAENACRQALQLNPEHAPSHHALGAVLHLQGCLADAVVCYRRAIQLQADFVEANYFLANALREIGQLDDAIVVYRALLKIQPGHFESLNNLGALLNHVGETQEAIEIFERALEQRPNSVELLNNLGNAYLQHGRPDKAVETFQLAVSLSPEFFDAYGGLSRALLNCGRIEEALAANEAAMGMRPDAVGVLSQRAHLLEVQGEFEKAFVLLEPLLESHLEDVAPIFFDISKHLGRREEAVFFLEKLLARSDLPNAAASKLYFRIGKHLDEVKEYDRAFEQYRLANSLCARPFDIRAVERQVDAIIHMYTPEFVSSMPRASNRSQLPVFVVGMPRSGTTLVEKILASHSAVYGAGELVDIGEVVSMLSRQIPGGEYPGFVGSMKPAQLDALAEKHLHKLSLLGDRAGRVVDKMPHNFLYLGLLLQLFPGSQVIHCTRNPLDTCLSCFFSSFGNTMHRYAYDLEVLGKYYTQYAKLMKHWGNVFGDEIYQVSYQNLVNSQETVSRKMVAICGLEWEERCMAFHESKRVAYTLSYDQVRRPIYSSSVDRWKNYEKHLGGLRRILVDAAVEY